MLVGHQLSKRRTSEIGPYNYWYNGVGDLERLFESWSVFDVSARVETIAESALSSREHLLLTVDDGFAGFGEYVLPLLERYKLNCIIFLTTGFIDAKLLPYELELAGIIEALDEIKTSKDELHRIDTPAKKKALYENLRLEVKFNNNRTRQIFLNSLLEMNQVKKEVFTQKIFLTWDEIHELDRHPLVTFGAHTVTHPFLNATSLYEAFREIILSKRKVEFELGKQINCFSYPYGGHSFLIRLLVRLAGFKYAFTTEHKVQTGVNFNPLSIPRLDIKKILMQSNSYE